jgi:hypothetical protein
MKRGKTNGYIMLIIGLVLVVLNVLDYILDFGWELPIIGILGIIFIAIGIRDIRLYKIKRGK